MTVIGVSWTSIGSCYTETVMQQITYIQLALKSDCRTVMRKKPVQQRSRQMVDRLIEATGQVIAQHGLDAVSTNRVAETAGVNIASLYQYFYDKSELIEALLDKASRDTVRMFNNNLATIDLQMPDTSKLLKIAMTVGLDFLRSNPLYMELINNWHRLPMHRLLDPLELYFQTLARQFFLQHLEDYAFENIQAKLFVLINSALFTMLRYLGKENPLLKEEDVVDALVETIVLSLGAGAVTKASRV
ncbi:TetR/AcrR family transcriptional regulator [Oleomonas cavernae]|nr:TetR/AcrR family transcriptional regulator [Oleomonas cavernae]